MKLDELIELMSYTSNPQDVANLYNDFLEREKDLSDVIRNILEPLMSQKHKDKYLVDFETMTVQKLVSMDVRKREITLVRDGRVVGNFPSANAACRSLGIPNENDSAKRVLARHGYEILHSHEI